jgi:hypothetical protein
LFDLDSDPDEFHDLGSDPAYAPVRERLYQHLVSWLRSRKIHPTISYPKMAGWSRKEQDVGILIGVWDPSDIESKQ